jgi:hypothetical protein
MKKSKFSKIRKGEYFRFVGKTKVYIYRGRADRKYRYEAADDASSDYMTASDRDIEIGFTY